MKKSLFGLSLLAGVVALMGSACTNIEASTVGEQVCVRIPVLVKPEVQTKNEKIEGTATVHSILGIFTWGPSEQAVGVDYGFVTMPDVGPLGELLAFTSKSEKVARNAAAYNATEPAGADLILAPKYVLTTKDYFFYKQIKCDVSGYPGFIKSLKVVDDPSVKAPAAAAASK